MGLAERKVAVAAAVAVFLVPISSGRSLRALRAEDGAGGRDMLVHPFPQEIQR